MLWWFHSNENDRYLMDKGFFCARLYIAYGNIEQNNNDFEGVGTLKSTFESVNNESDEGGPKCKRIESTIINKVCSKADRVVTFEATTDEY